MCPIDLLFVNIIPLLFRRNSEIFFLCICTFGSISHVSGSAEKHLRQSLENKPEVMQLQVINYKPRHITRCVNRNIEIKINENGAYVCC